MLRSCRIREITRVASKDWTPKSKELSRTLTFQHLVPQTKFL